MLFFARSNNVVVENIGDDAPDGVTTYIPSFRGRGGQETKVT